MGGKKKTENEKQNTCPVESENGPRTQDKDALMIWESSDTTRKKFKIAMKCEWFPVTHRN